MTHGRLVVPEGLIIDELARERLTRQVQRQPLDVNGVAALVTELPPGSSYRVHAEWRSLEPLSACVAVPDARVRGAVLVRPNVGFEVVDGIVSVDGAIVADQGAHTHDPWAPLGPLRTASEEGRPPFPHRPVVIFAAADPIPTELSEWARRMVNRLIRREIEGRLALAATDDALQLTRPCLAGAESIRALAPDVVVTLDAGAAERVGQWCGDDRSIVVVELIDDVTITQRLVSWQIARARGRVRAQISRRIGVASLATLVRRLCAGPQPMPPTDRVAEVAASVRVREDWGARAARPTCVVLTGNAKSSVGRRTRTEGLIDQFEAAGVGVERAAVSESFPPSAAAATLVLLVGAVASPALTALVEARSRNRLATVVDIDPSELSVRADDTGDALVLDPDVAALAALGKYVVAPTEAVVSALGGLSVRSLTVPMMLTRERFAALRSAGLGASTGGHAQRDPIIGWQVGDGHDLRPDYLDAVVEGIAKVLADRVDVRVDIVGDADRVPAMLRRHDRVSVSALPAQPERVAAWALHVWSPSILAGEIVDDLQAVIEASCAGVPTVLPDSAGAALDGTAANALVVAGYETPEAWSDALRTLLDDPKGRAEYSADVRRWSQSVHGSSSCRATVTRLLGWASYKVKR